MLSEEDKQELQAMARSERVREEFRAIRAAGRPKAQEWSSDDFITFLTFLHRLPAFPPSPRPFPIYTNIRL